MGTVSRQHKTIVIASHKLCAGQRLVGAPAAVEQKQIIDNTALGYGESAGCNSTVLTQDGMRSLMH
jgi:hypothetical protein